MTKWIADYEVESHLSVAKDDIKLKYKAPDDSYEVHIKNLDVTPPIEKPLLSVQVILECDDIKKVKDKSKEYLKKFLIMLSLATNQKFTIHSLKRILDWTPGLSMRDCLQFKSFPNADIPMPFLNDEILKTVNTLMRRDISDELNRALRWFAHGIAVDHLQEQFQYFWFALETLAAMHKDVSKVPDQCPKCQEPLYCKKCETTPMHRPYPKHAIEQLIKKVITGDPEKLCKILSDIRHALLHGDDIDEIEKTLPNDKKLLEFLDVLGKTVWVALINSFQFEKETELNFLETDKYAHYQHVITLVAKIGSNPNPEIEDISNPEIKMNVRDKNDVKGD